MSNPTRFFVLSKSPTGVVVAREVPDDFDSLPDVNEPGRHVVGVKLEPGQHVVGVELEIAPFGDERHTISATSWFDPDGVMSLTTTEPLPVALVAYSRLIEFFGDVESFGHTPRTHASVLPLPDPEPLLPVVLPGFVGFRGAV